MPTPTRYQDLSAEVAGYVSDLTRGRIAPAQPCHLDPDIDIQALPRKSGWRGALGQVAAAQSHLAKNHVGRGDLFLFWGLFRPVTRSTSGKWAYNGTTEHRIFGWLQVDEVLTVANDPASVLGRYPWLAAHPHISTGWSASNTVYIAKKTLDLSPALRTKAGYGLLKRGFRLTTLGSSRPSVWTMPSWINPTRNGTGLTYHPLGRWSADGTLLAAARGQEFIADVDSRRDALDWITGFFAEEV
jgi:hypothetical protein